MPRYKCPACKTRYKSAIPVNMDCPSWSCQGRKLEPYTGSKTTGFRMLGKATEKFEAQRQQRQQRIASMRNLPKPKYAEPDLKREDFDDPLDYQATFDDLEEVKARELEREAADFAFVPNATRWEFDQRLTSDDMVERTSFPPGLTALKKTPASEITAPVQGEREKQCCTVMGNTLGVKSISAHGASNQVGSPIGKRWSLGEKDTAEWCHLVGVSLGGYTKAANLVAASYCANTYMGVIEKHIQARTDLEVQVETFGVVHANKALAELSRHVAELITYAISDRQTGKRLVQFNIDARINAFSAKDRDTLQSRLKLHVPAKKT